MERKAGQGPLALPRDFIAPKPQPVEGQSGSVPTSGAVFDRETIDDHSSWVTYRIAQFERETGTWPW